MPEYRFVNLLLPEALVVKLEAHAQELGQELDALIEACLTQSEALIATGLALRLADQPRHDSGDEDPRAWVP